MLRRYTPAFAAERDSADRAVDRQGETMRCVCALAVVALWTVAATAAPEAASQAAARSRTIAVMPLTDLKNDKDTAWIGPGAAETICNKLVGVPGLSVVERRELAAVAAEQDLQRAAATDLASAAKVGRMAGAERIVVGTFAADSGSVLFNIRVLDASSGLVVSTATVTTKLEGVLAGLADVAEAVVESFQKKVVVAQAKPAVADAPASERVALSDEQKKLLRQRGAASVEALKAMSMAAGSSDLAEALKWLTKAIELDPAYGLAYMNRGAILGGIGKHDLAIADLTKAIELMPANAMAYNNRGVVYTQKGDARSALADYAKAIALDGAYAAPLSNRSVIYTGAGKAADAVADCTAAIEINPRYASAYYNRGNARMAAKAYDAAMKDYDAALEIRPGYADCWYAKGNALVGKGNLPAALKAYDAAVKANPRHASAYNNRAIVNMSMKRYDDAWADVKACRAAGGTPNPDLIKKLTQESGHGE
jgi:tetratricopeptide (TPR) repeat protein